MPASATRSVAPKKGGMIMTIAAPAGFGAPAALGADLGREVAGRDDDRNAAGDVIEHRRHHRFALAVGQHELLGEIRQDAECRRSPHRS